MLISLEGEEATGKTTFAYTAPLKVVGFSFDMGAQRALYGGKASLFEGLKINVVPYPSGCKPIKAWEDFDIAVYEMPRPVQLRGIRIQGCIAMWEYLVQLYNMAMEDPTVRSVVLDTATIARRVRCDAFLEDLQDNTPKGKEARVRLTQIEYGAPNDDIRALYTRAEGIKKNLILVHHLTDEYKDHINSKGDKEQVITGRRVLEGLKGTHRAVDVALLLEEEKGEVVGTMLKCGYNLGLKGASLANPTWDSVATRISMSLGDRLEFERRNQSG